MTTMHHGYDGNSELDQYESFAWHKGEKAVAERVKTRKNEEKNAHVSKEDRIDDDDLYQDELIREIEEHENKKGADTVSGGHHKQFEWVLVCEHDREKQAGKPSEEVQQLLAALEAARLELHHYASITGTEYYIKVSSHDKELLGFAEQMRLQCRLKPQQAVDNKGKVINDGGPTWFGGIVPFNNGIRQHFVPATQQHLYMRIPFPTSKKERKSKSATRRTHRQPVPESQGGPSFFTSGERQQIIRHIIQCPIDEGGCDISLESAVEANHMRSLEGEHYEEYKLTKEKERLAKLAQVKRDAKERENQRMQREKERKRRLKGGDDMWMIGGDDDDEDSPVVDIEAEDDVDENEDQQWAACIKAYFPLHDDDELFDLLTIWARPGLVIKYPISASASY